MLSPLQAAQAAVNAAWAFARYCRMFAQLLKVIRPDCRRELVIEFITDPEALKRRWRYEQAFQTNLRSRWVKPSN